MTIKSPYATEPEGTSGIHLEDAHGYLDRVIRELQSLRTDKKHPLLGVLQFLSEHIRSTRSELSSLRRNSGRVVLTSTADELEEVVAETARAANDIMGAAETIEALIPKVDPDTAQALLAAVTRIYEASAFQDITGQRISKIIRAVLEIESSIDALLNVCGDGLESAEAPIRGGDESLLNGPQCADHASSQDAIDALFESL